MSVTSHSLPAVVGSQLRWVREHFGLTQDHISRAAKSLGLSWGRSSVALLEQGNRRLSAEELLLLPAVVAVAGRLAGADGIALADARFGLDYFLNVPMGRRLELSDVVKLTANEARGMLKEGDEGSVGTGKSSYFRAIRRVSVAASPDTEFERRIAAQLEIDFDDLDVASQNAWGCSLYEERERRLEGTGDRRSDQAVRGHITRQLVSELRSHFEEG